jgi:hypothetical protein
MQSDPPVAFAQSQCDGDAEHIAIAATNSVDLLLTWNCKHLANPIIHREVVRACEAKDFRCPQICTPEKLMGTCHAKSNPFGASAHSDSAVA